MVLQQPRLLGRRLWRLPPPPPLPSAAAAGFAPPPPPPPPQSTRSAARKRLALHPRRLLSSGSGDTASAAGAAVKLHYVEFSEGPSSSRMSPPIVIAHGMLGASSNWGSVAKKISERTKRRVVCFDCRNHGRSPHTEKMSYFDMVGDLCNLVREDLGSPDGAVLVGHSMGGRTAMLAALTKPDMVQQLVVVDVSPLNRKVSALSSMSAIFEAMLAVQFPRGDDGLTMPQARKDVGDQLQRNGIADPMLRSWLLMNLEGGVDGGGFRWRNNVSAIYEAFKTDLAEFPSPPLATRYDKKTTFISGEKSSYLPESHHEEIRRRLFPRASFETVAGAGHWVHAEKPQEFLRVLEKCL